MLHLVKHTGILSSRISFIHPAIYHARTATRHSVYGTEEGHHIKNEVRKEKWIRKRMRRPLGGDWREAQGIPRNIHCNEGPFAEGSEWSYADGRPGVPSFTQLKRTYEQRQYAHNVKAALDLVKSYQQSYKDKQKEILNQEEAAKNSRLMEKGNKFV